MKRNASQLVSAQERGFTLIEVLVALSVLAIVLLPLLQVFTNGLQLGAAAEGYRKALNVAESQIAEAAARLPYAERTHSGVTDDYRWRLTVRPYEEGATPPLYAFEAAVHWRAGRHDRSLTLETLRLEPTAEPAK